MTTVATPLQAAVTRPDPALLREWEDLAHRSGASPFSYPGWTTAFVGAFGGDLRLVTVHQGEELVAVAPFIGGRRRTTPTGWHTPWHDIAAVDADARRAAWAALIDAPAVVVDHVLDGSADARAIDDVLADRGGKHRIRERQRPPYLDLEGTWDDFVAAMSSNLRGDTRRRARRLAEQGEVRFEVLTDPADLERVLDEGLAVEGSGWKTRSGTAVTSDAATEDFYRALAAWAAPRGVLRLCFLRVDERAVAFDFSLEAAGRHYLLKTGYDEAWSKSSAGKVLRWEVLRDCFERGVDTYEFTGDAAPWKAAWTDESRRTVEYYVFAPSVAGWLAWVAWRTWRAGRAVVKRLRRS